MVEMRERSSQNMKISGIICLGITSFCVLALDFTPGNREAMLESARLRAVVRDGRIIHLENRKTGKVYADRAFEEKSVTAGMGQMAGKGKKLSKLHFPWGEPSLGQHREIKQTDLYHYPDEKSAYSAVRKGNEIVISWKGLTDGKQLFDKEELSIHFSEDSRGALVFQGKGSSPDKGVFAVQIPLENITQESTFLLPTFGGLEYSGKGKSCLMSFHSTTLFYEAPVMICSVGKDTFSMWSEDNRFRTFFAFLTRNKKSCSFALEFENLIPFEQHSESVSNPIKLDVFEDSDWVAAARPYRDWYHKTFAKEIAIRDSGWANDIAVISDIPGNKKKLEQAASLLPPGRVLFHIWQARKAGFTKDVPDYTPYAGYPKQVASFHELGFKVMCYVCALCVTYGNDLWKRDKLETLVLTRRTTITNYNGSNAAFDENLVGNIVKSEKGKSPFASLKPGQLLYTDPLSGKWRVYYSNLIRKFNELTGTDANYQDTLGCAEDVGNGVIDGLSGAEGNAELARVLQKKVGVPMASEFGGAPIAFAVKWPLNFAQVWGGNAFRLSRIHRHRPLTPYLFGYRTWVPYLRVNSDFQKHLISAVSDALSGLGMFDCSKEIQNKEGFDGHLILRSQIFAQNGLEPYYPEKRYPENIRAMYQGKDGGIFQYYDDGKLQMMLSPEGKPLYGRANNVTEIRRSDLVLPGWPVWDEKGIYSLDPKKHYALFPMTSGSRPKLRVSKLEEGTALKLFYETGEFLYLEIGGKKKTGSVNVNVPEGFTQVICNDKYETIEPGENSFSGKLPLRLIFSSGKTTVQPLVRNINMTGGLQIGAPEVPKINRRLGSHAMYFVNYFNAKCLDQVLKVQKPDDAVEVYFQNLQGKYGNGSTVELLVNGKREAFFDCFTRNPAWKKGSAVPRNLWDRQLRKWTVPVGKFAGKNILVSLRVSNKNDNNADYQIVSIPVLVTAPVQTFREEIVKTPAPAPKSSVKPRPKGKISGVLIPEWNPKNVTSAGDHIFAYKPTSAGGVSYWGNIKIDPTKRYYLSGELRAAKKASIYLGVVEMDSKGRWIFGVHVNPVKNSLTRLSHPAEKGSKKLMVTDASAWQPGNLVAFNASEDLKDLPNMTLAGPVETIRKGGSDWTVMLKSPLKFNVESDTLVRQHRDMSTYSYLFAGTVDQSWKSFGGEIKWRPGATAFKYLIISQKPFEFRNLKLELYQP